MFFALLAAVKVLGGPRLPITLLSPAARRERLLGEAKPTHFLPFFLFCPNAEISRGRKQISNNHVEKQRPRLMNERGSQMSISVGVICVILL